MTKAFFTIRFMMTVCISILMVMITYGCSSDAEVIYSDIDDYQTCIDEVEGSDAFMPSISELNDYDNIELYCVEQVGKTVSINLVVTYTADDYADRKVDMNERYAFLGHPLYNNGRTLIEDDRFDYNDFTIRVAEADGFRYPAQFGMIGHSDTHFKVAYMFYSDDSIISMEYSSMEAFVDSQFAFNAE